jgi:antitoxin component YwqK of YwqJK toxin-antitoxin module
MLKNIYFFLFLLLAKCSLAASIDTLYIDKNLNSIAQQIASYKLIRERISENSSKGICYDLKGTRLWKGEFIGQHTLSKFGRFEHFNAYGKIIRIENYQNDLLQGEAILFDDYGQHINEIRNYYSNKGAYTFAHYDKQGKHITQSGNYDLFGQKTGLWKEYFYQTDSLRLLTNYKEGRKDGESIEYYQNGQIKRLENYKYGKLSDKKMLDENGYKMKYFPAFQYPEYKEPLYKYLFQKTECFEQIRKTETFEISFFVSEDGSLSDIKIEGVKNEIYKNELLKAISVMAKWKPALKENQAFAMRYKKEFKPYSPKD